MENEEKSPEFGRYLRTHRRSKGISLEVVSQKTKITVASLRHLEDEDLDKLPAPPFVKGFIQAYAEVVGVDVQEALHRYEEKLAPLEEKEQHVPLILENEDRRSWRPIVLIGFGCMLVGIAAFFLIHYLSAPEKMPPQEMVSNAQTDQEIEPVETPLPAETAKPEPKEIPQQDGEGGDVETDSRLTDTPAIVAGQEPVRVNPPEPLAQPSVTDSQEATTAPQKTTTTESAPAEEEIVLDITAVERTWLRVTIDQKQIKEVTIDPQDKITLKAQKQFELFIGNAGGVKLELNGEAVDVPGGSGRVAKMRLP